ncbi:hypothetical protein LTR15_004811 [Elasticomyces elasticus]|nr:hypothetical protein LTR15_004811 [Elasticomyces elasticus]
MAQARHYWTHPAPSRVLNRSEIQSILRDDYKLDLKFNAYRNDQLANILERLQLDLPKRSEDAPQLAHLIPAKELPSRYPAESWANFRQRLVALLDTKPKRRRFRRFLDLPPELRQRVYEYAFSYSDNAYYLQQPAVSRVSRLLRTESLPIFYKCNRFGITVKRSWRGPEYLWQNMCDVWPTFICTEHLAMMRYFEVKLMNIDNKHALRIKIDLPSLKGDEPLSIRVWSVTPEKHTEHLQHCQAAIECQITDVVEQILEGQDHGRLGTKEIQLMALSIRHAFISDEEISWAVQV